MNDMLIDISGKIDKRYIEAVREIKKIAESQRISFFLVGASVRDYILEIFYNIKAPRRTYDVDFGMEVKTWAHFDALIHALVISGKFKKDYENQRVIFNNDICIDIVPFGAIAGGESKLRWPRNHDMIMNVLGFNEAYACSTLVRLSADPVLEIRMATLPGLSVLKLLSWKEKYPERKKDAEDILFIMMHYEHAGIFDRLYNSEIQLLTRENFDTRTAGIYLLGKDMAKMCTQKTLDFIKNILQEETDDTSKFNLVLQMMGRNDDFDDVLVLLKKLKLGVFKG